MRQSDSKTTCELYEDDGSERPHYLPPIHRQQVTAIEMADRIINAAEEFKRQMVMDEPDTGFVPAAVLREVHVHVMDNPNITVAAVVGRAVKMLFQNYLNCEEIGPELAKIILQGRLVEPVEAAPQYGEGVLDHVVSHVPIAEPEAEPSENDEPVRRTRRGTVWKRADPWTPAPFRALTDEEWAACEPLLPDEKATGRPRTDMRPVLDAIAHHWRTGCPWRMLPDHLPSWQTSYTHFKRLLKAGITPALREIICPSVSPPLSGQITTFEQN